MSRVQLQIGNLPNRMTAKALLEAAGHEVTGEHPDVVVSDDPQAALRLAPGVPTLLLATLGDVPRAVDAMRQGVHGYVLLPFLPGELTLMIARATAQKAAAPPEETPLLPLEEVERRHITAVLRACRNNRAKAARILKIGRNTLWRKIRAWEDNPAG